MSPSYQEALPRHERINHDARQFVGCMAHGNGMESFLASLKRARHGTFHTMSLRRLHRDADEFAGRHAIRARNTGDRMTHIVACMVGGSLSFRELIG